MYMFKICPEKDNPWSVANHKLHFNELFDEIYTKSKRPHWDSRPNYCSYVRNDCMYVLKYGLRNKTRPQASWTPVVFGSTSDSQNKPPTSQSYSTLVSENHQKIYNTSFSAEQGFLKLKL